MSKIAKQVRRVQHCTRTALYRRMHCAWCWRTLHIVRWYPPRWSSTICNYHKQQERARLAASRACKHAAIKSVIPAQKELQG